MFSGTIGVTLFGLFFTPVFYSVIRRLVAGHHGKPVLVTEKRLTTEPVGLGRNQGDGEH